MSQGFFTAVGGILAAQSKIDVISDNIANMNTVGFKESTIAFENIYSKTMSSGSAPSVTTGGTNPMQIGLGVQIGDISRNFQGGTIQSTGRESDLNIQGDGFFTVTDSTGQTLLTRAGNFSIDSEGSLVTAAGLHVLGTNSIFGLTGSSNEILIPPQLNLSTSGNTALATKDIADLNNANLTDGTFTISVTDTTPATTDVTVDTTGCTTVGDIATAINTACTAAGFGGVTATTSNGKLVLSANSTGVGNPVSLSFANDTSNLVSESQLNIASGSTAGAVTSYSSKVLDYVATISPADGGSTTQAYSSFSVGNDGAIEAVYTNGDRIGITTNGSSRELKYTTSTGIVISNDNITVNGGAIEAADLQLQIAKVVNNKGLISNGGNTFRQGPNSGDATFGIADNAGFGSISSGGLEASNVDLPSQFAEMILAQRVVDANSQTFRTINEVLRRIVMMGQ